MKVKVISILEDNYMYLVIEENGKKAIAVDPAVPHRFGTLNVRCLFTPCHTSGHMCYFVWEDGCTDAPAVFTGDTLFVAGCGRFFEGTAQQMYKNLTEVLSTLPLETKVFCGHEYTVKNLKFALKVEPDNAKVKEMLAWAKARDDDDKPTVPSSLEDEFQYNPFLRLSEEAVQKFTGKTDPVEVLSILRAEKDKFKKPKERLPTPAMLAFQWALSMSKSETLQGPTDRNMTKK
ncbi:HAGHL protein, partial [Polypterus senegalus]